MSDSDGRAGQMRDAAATRGSRLRFPKLLALVGLLFALDLVVPDFIPFIDEIILGLMTAILAVLRERKQAPTKPESLPEEKQ